ncbi:MAG TPA: TMEM175 family protein [Candidatus Binataceae bacterium]|nr:TMEM175 family protein [Candidatus Binataceae bacterium]
MSDSSKQTARSPGKRLEFDLRGRQMNRIEAVSDVVFGFALTLLVVSLQVPRTYADLVDAMHGFPAFALAFAALMVVWARHYYFFRYYGLDDPATIVLNTLLLFVVLFYAYPLKFLCTIWLSPLTGTPMEISNAQGGMRLVMALGDQRGLMLIFGSGFAALYFVFGAMYWHAWRVREVLHLSAFEIAHTRTSVIIETLNGGVALLSMLAACALKPEHAGAAGYVYFLLVPVIALWRRRRRALEREFAPRPL